MKKIQTKNNGSILDDKEIRKFILEYAKREMVMAPLPVESSGDDAEYPNDGLSVVSSSIGIFSGGGGNYYCVSANGAFSTTVPQASQLQPLASVMPSHGQAFGGGSLSPPKFTFANDPDIVPFRVHETRIKPPIARVWQKIIDYFKT